MATSSHSGPPQIGFPSPHGERISEVDDCTISLALGQLLFPSPHGERISEGGWLTSLPPSVPSFHPLTGKGFQKATTGNGYATFSHLRFHPLTGKGFQKSKVYSPCKVRLPEGFFAG